MTHLNRRSFVAAVAVAMTGCIDGENQTPTNDDGDEANRTDEPLNESEYGGEAQEGTLVLNEEVNVETPYGDDYSPVGLHILNTGDEKKEVTVRLLEDGGLIYSVTLDQESGYDRRMYYIYSDFIGKTGDFKMEVEVDEEVHELECETGPGFGDLSVDIDHLEDCSNPEQANISIRKVTETPDGIDVVSSEERSEYETLESFVESYRECEDDPEEKEVCATEDGELDFFRGGVSGRRYGEYERIIEGFPRHESEDDDYPTGTYIEHDGEVYVFELYFARA